MAMGNSLARFEDRLTACDGKRLSGYPFAPAQDHIVAC